MLIKVKVFPGSKKEKVIRKAEDSFEVKVKEKAEKGLATKAALKALSSFLQIPEAKIRLVRGARQRNKIFEVENKK